MASIDGKRISGLHHLTEAILREIGTYKVRTWARAHGINLESAGIEV